MEEEIQETPSSEPEGELTIELEFRAAGKIVLDKSSRIASLLDVKPARDLVPGSFLGMRKSHCGSLSMRMLEEGVQAARECELPPLIEFRVRERRAVCQGNQTMNCKTPEEAKIAAAAEGERRGVLSAHEREIDDIVRCDLKAPAELR